MTTCPGSNRAGRYPFTTPATFLGEFQQPSDKPPAISRASAIPAARQLTFSFKRTKRHQHDEPIFSQNKRIPTSWPNLAHPINHTFGSVRHRLVSFRQEFRQDRKVLRSTTRFSGRLKHRQCKSALGVSPRQPSARSNRKRICLSGNHGQSDVG